MTNHNQETVATESGNTWPVIGWFQNPVTAGTGSSDNPMAFSDILQNNDRALSTTTSLLQFRASANYLTAIHPHTLHENTRHLYLTTTHNMSSSVMTFPRMLQHPVTSSFTVCRARSVSPSRRCIQGLRMFSSQKPTYNSPKRELQTATAYRPHTLSSFPPPRNTGIPETSIAADTPESGLPNTTSHQDSAATKNNNAILDEGEAQKSKPVNAPASSATSASSQKSSKPRRSKLKPRKAAMTISPTAAAQLRTLLSQPDPKMIRVGVKNRGCSGLSYHLEYVDKPGTFDEVVEQDGVKVLVDSKALFSIIGSQMDWQEDKLSKRFVFNNPNISKYFYYYSIPIPKTC